MSQILIFHKIKVGNIPFEFKHLSFLPISALSAREHNVWYERVKQCYTPLYLVATKKPWAEQRTKHDRDTPSREKKYFTMRAFHSFICAIQKASHAQKNHDHHQLQQARLIHFDGNLFPP